MLEEQIKGYEKQLSDLSNEINMRIAEMHTIIKKINICYDEIKREEEKNHCVWIYGIPNVGLHCYDYQTTCQPNNIEYGYGEKITKAKYCMYCGREIKYRHWDEEFKIRKAQRHHYEYII